MSVIHAAGAPKAPEPIMNAIKTASLDTGVDFGYLVNQAKAESSFNPTVKAKTSSATGLFQFIESTWMNLVDKHGEKYGIDKAMSKSDLLELRKNPALSSFMAAELATENKNYLAENVGGKIGSTELYFAHFMGARGASDFLNAREAMPDTAGAELFPKAAKANQGVFYNKDGSARSLDEIYAFFDRKFSAEKIEMHAKYPQTNRPVENAAQVETSEMVAENTIEANSTEAIPVSAPEEELTPEELNEIVVGEMVAEPIAQETIDHTEVVKTQTPAKAATNTTAAPQKQTYMHSMAQFDPAVLDLVFSSIFKERDLFSMIDGRSLGSAEKMKGHLSSLDLFLMAQEQK